jgi:hypothetical protein
MATDRIGEKHTANPSPAFALQYLGSQNRPSFQGSSDRNYFFVEFNFYRVLGQNYFFLRLNV